MFLSIVIPVYNDEKYLEECLNSCLHQDISPDEYEIICVDDGSTDRTPDILRRYAETYHNIVLIWKEHGVGFGRCVGLEQAHGDYIWFVDHDDIIHENILAGFKAKVSETGCDRLVFDGYSFQEELTETELQKIANGTLKTNIISFRDGAAWTSIVRRSFLQEHNISPRTERLQGRGYAVSTDSFYIYELKREGIEDVFYGGIPLYYYRQHRGSQRSVYAPEKIKERIYGQVKLARFVKDDYEEAVRKNGFASNHLSVSRVLWARYITMTIASLPKDLYQEGRRMMKEEGILPTVIPDDDTYTVRDCIKYPNGMGLLRSIGYYYSTYPLGLSFYRATFVKVFVSRLLRKNAFASKLLDFRKRIKQDS